MNHLDESGRATDERVARREAASRHTAERIDELSAQLRHDDSERNTRNPALGTRPCNVGKLHSVSAAHPTLWLLISSCNSPAGWLVAEVDVGVAHAARSQIHSGVTKLSLPQHVIQTLFAHILTNSISVSVDWCGLSLSQLFRPAILELELVKILQPM